MKSKPSTLQQRRRQAQRPAASSSQQAPRASQMPWTPATLTTRMLGPLRLFLGVTFAYAGIQKLTDSQFFAPSAPGYIGRQITTFAAGSPIRALLLNLALPHAALFGSLIAWGELAIGVGALLGLLFRPAAFFGALLSLTFFLSASWRVHPYFYGSDIVFLFAWLTLLLAGPAAGGWFALDTGLASWLAARIPAESFARFERAAAVALGVHPPVIDLSTARGRSAGHTGRAGRYATATRRDFLKGAFAGVAATLGAALAITLFSKGGPNATQAAPAATATTDATGAGDIATATPGSASSGATIAVASQVPVNSATSFTIPSNGDPGVLVHLANGDFAAFDAICTHAGCPVQYDPSSKLLLCPCHGAAFDPAQNAAVAQGPADTPLASVPIHIANQTGDITVSN